MTTESILRDWRFGQTQAERLCAGLLQVLSYESVDPQAPLGGPDGKKDVLARRDGKLAVAAVYFPPTSPTFGEIKTKYLSDRTGVDANGAQEFVFFVNQHLTVSQRAELQALGSSDDVIMHLERIRHLLDTPIGYGLRLQYLRLPMSTAEQVSYFNATQQEQVHKLLRNLQESDQLWEPGASAISQLNVSAIQLLHSAVNVGSDYQHTIGGQFRAVQVVVAGIDGTPQYVPPTPEEVPGRLNDLLGWWRQAYVTADRDDVESILELFARFHHGLVAIAPFVDANGRLARLIIDLAARELLGCRIAADLVADRPTYYDALSSADQEDLEGLIGLMRAALERQSG